jgi:glycosyltransferase involved in cell wall biosynthesis
MRIFALAIGDRSRASSRLRVWDHLDWLKSYGHTVDADYFTPRNHYGSTSYKIWYMIVRIPKWMIKIAMADFVIIQEVIMIWPLLLLLRMSTRTKFLYDFSDPIDTLGKGLRNDYQRIGLIIMTRCCQYICVENKQYVLELENRGIKAYHFYGPVDVERYNLAKEAKSNVKRECSPFRIGWTGSPSTFHFIEALVDSLESLAKYHDIELMLIGVTSIPRSPKNLRVILKPWSEECEYNLVPTFDLGLFVLNNDYVSNRRGAGKIFVYLAAGVPFAASNIGIARDIMDESLVGYRVYSESDWELTIKNAIANRHSAVEIGEVSQSYARQTISYEQYRSQLRQILKSI